MQNVVLEILKITLPPIVLGFVMYYLVREFFAKEYRIRLADMQQRRQETTLPLRIQAYERLAIFCERISIPKLILRIRTESMMTADLHVALAVAIEQEYDHNVAQQVYVSPGIWQALNTAKNEAMILINMAAKEMPENSDGLAYSRSLFEFLNTHPQVANEKALIALKTELQQLL